MEIPDRISQEDMAAAFTATDSTNLTCTSASLYGVDNPRPEKGKVPRQLLDLSLDGKKHNSHENVPLVSFNPAYYVKSDKLKELMEASKEKEVEIGDKLICTKHIRSGGAEAHQDIEYDVVEISGEHVRLVPESNPHYEAVMLKTSTVQQFFIDAHSEHVRKGHRRLVGEFEEEDLWREKDAISRIRHVDLSEKYKPMLAVATTAREKKEEIAVMRILESVAKGSKQPGRKFYSHPKLAEPSTWTDHTGAERAMRGQLSEPNHHQYRWPGEVRKGEHRTYTPKMKAVSFSPNSDV